MGYAYETVAAVLGNRLQYTSLLLSNRDDFVKAVRLPNRLPKLLLRDLPWDFVVLVDFVAASALAAAFDQKQIPQDDQTEIINSYQTTLADCADRNGGELAVAKDDGFLFAFQKAEQTVVFAVDLQESLAIKRPILGPLGPLRVRIVIHSSSQGIQRLFEESHQIANMCQEGQVLISESTRRSLDKSAEAGLEFIALRSTLEFKTAEKDPEPVKLYEVNKVVALILEQKELASLKKQNPTSKSGGGFQAFLVDLQERIKEGNKLTLTVRDRERIARYSHDYHGGGWQGRLQKIFGRSLGPNLGRETS